MDKSHIRKEISALINSIKEHSDNIGAKEHIPQLELELILMKIEKLYQKSIVFNHLHSVTNGNSEKKEETPVVVPPAVKAPEVVVPKEEIKPIDLFGEVAKVEKPKAEKKVEPKPEKKEEAAPIAKIQKPRLESIKAAIGINDKFQFANELFEGSMSEFEIAVQQLNTAETLESAVEYFMSIQQLYNWNNESETVKRLFDLVERRYS